MRTLINQANKLETFKIFKNFAGGSVYKSMIKFGFLEDISNYDYDIIILKKI